MAEKTRGSTFISSSGKEQPITLFWVRHAQAGGDATSDYDGPPLTDLGRKQAERVARRLSDYHFDHVYSSTMLRAKATAEMIHVYHKETPVTFIEDLREVTHYHFLADLMPKDKAVIEQVRKEKDGIVKFVNHVRHHHNPGDKLLVVCHGNMIRTIMPMFGGRDPGECILMEINNTGLSVLDTWTNGEAVLLLANCVKHLMPKQIS
jgi:broad specificity phosphatase PhoE